MLTSYICFFVVFSIIIIQIPKGGGDYKECNSSEKEGIAKEGNEAQEPTVLLAGKVKTGSHLLCLIKKVISSISPPARLGDELYASGCQQLPQFACRSHKSRGTSAGNDNFRFGG